MKKRNPLLIAGFALLAVTSIVVLVYVMRLYAKPKIISVGPTELLEGRDSTVQVLGKNFPDIDRISLEFGGIPATIISKTKNDIYAAVDLSKFKELEAGQEFSKELVVSFKNSKVQGVETIRVKPDSVIKVTDMNTRSFKARDWIIFHGNNLHRTGQIEVWFSNDATHEDANFPYKAAIRRGSRKELRVRVPLMKGAQLGENNVEIRVAANGQTIYSTTGKYMLFLVGTVLLDSAVIVTDH